MNRGLGPWPVVSLAEARDIAFENVRRRQRGENPFERPTETAPTFAATVDACIKHQAQGWKKGSRNEANWRSTFAHASALSDRPVDKIDTSDVLGVVSRLLRSGKTPTARVLRARIRIVLDYAIASGYRAGPNPANGELDSILPPTSHRVVNHESVEPAGIVDVLTAAAGIEDPTWRGTLGAFRLLVLTATRTAEVIGARWSEFDLAAAVWTIPASRMKARRDHRVPLSAPALEVLHDARARTGGTGLVFRAPRGGNLDTAALRRVMRRLGRSETVHGFRGSFKSWCMENSIPRDLAELSLAHSYMGDTEQSYVRTDLLDRRRPVMERWSAHCTGAVDEDRTVVNFR